jgi:FkbM family methyltransferase
VPGFRKKTIRGLIGWVIRLLRLNDGRGILGPELAQMLQPEVRVNTNHGEVLLLASNGRLKWRAETMLSEEPGIINWIDNSMDANTVFLDLGANIGLYSLYSLKRGVQQAYCCELDYLNLSLLYKHLVRNKVVKKALIIPFAASSSITTGDVFFRDLSEGDALQSINRPSPFSTNIGEYAHSSTQILYPLDVLFDTLKLVKPTHIKIDVDGNEIDALQGMRNMIKHCKEIYMEYSNEIDSESRYCQKILFEAGFVEKTRIPIFKVGSGKTMKDVLGHNIIYTNTTSLGSESKNNASRQSGQNSLDVTLE